MEYSNIEQGGLEWHMARVGKFTASTAWKFMDRTAKGLPTAEFTNQKWAIIEERLIGRPRQTFQNDAMRWGIEQEPIARAFYSELSDIEIQEVGLVIHPEYDFVACSPDGLIQDDGLLEIKNPSTKTYLEVMLCGKPQEQYVWQCQFQMWVTGRDYCDLLYFDSRLPAEIQSTIFNIERNDEKIAQLESTILEVEDDINRIIKAIYEKR